MRSIAVMMIMEILGQYMVIGGPVGGGGYGNGGQGQHDFIEYQGPRGYGSGGGGGHGGGRHGGGGYGCGYCYQRPLQLLKIIKEDEPEGIFDTFLSPPSWSDWNRRCCCPVLCHY